MPYTPIQRVLAKQRKVRRLEDQVRQAIERVDAARLEVAEALRAIVKPDEDGNVDMVAHIAELEADQQEQVKTFEEACRTARNLLEDVETAGDAT